MSSPTQRVLEEALSIGAQGLRIAQTRLEMLSVDLQREKAAVARQLALAVACGTSAALAAFATVLWVALSFEPRTRFIVLGVLAGVFLLIAIVCGVLFRRALARRERLFATLIEALKRDGEALEPRRTREAA
ncbi:MAG: phage holin family protein [Steroidobacteraceae bacterium]|nr:phage holin family protein [Steroidobacteraceae bacterium]MCW5572528.1 phage holin family protein [Steroidobacteraceae bacterium]